jgi:hypothetical protein
MTGCTMRLLFFHGTGHEVYSLDTMALSIPFDGQYLTLSFSSMLDRVCKVPYST